MNDGLLVSAVPARNSGSLPAVKMNSWEILSRRPCAWSDVTASVSPMQLDRYRRIGPPGLEWLDLLGLEETLRSEGRQGSLPPNGSYISALQVVTIGSSSAAFFSRRYSDAALLAIHPDGSHCDRCIPWL